MKLRTPTWTELTALVVAFTGLLNWWTEHKRATKAEAQVEQKRERIEQLDGFLMQNRTELFE